MNETHGAPLCLDTLAWIAAGEHDPSRAATLLGAAAALTQAMGTLTVTYPDLAGYHEQCERQTRRALGERAFQVAFRHGSTLSVEDAIAYAMKEKMKEKPQAEQAPASTEKTTLTRREREVAEGLSNKEIADRLVISQRTAETHVEHILAKLGFTSRTQIPAWLTQ